MDLKVKAYIDNAESQSKQYYLKLKDYIQELQFLIENTKKQEKNFLTFDKIKKIIFIIGCISNFLSLIFLIWLIFLKK